ncbi:MAG: hypothetical protein RL645_718 [Actinomycetota bacterium]|jgi:hypothetical protein
MNAPKSKLSLSFWLALAALVVGAWPLFQNLTEILRNPGLVSDSFRYFDFTPTSFSYLQYTLLPFTEPVLMIAAVLINAFATSRVLRALPGFALALGVVTFFIVNAIAFGLLQSSGTVWEWTFGSAPASYLYGLAILLSVAAAIASLLNKPAASSTVGPAAASGRQPVAFDTATGQPIYGYDTSTGAPIY